MEGDFTRNSDDPTQQFSGVLMQQGRVQIDADWNEQWAIQTRALRSALADLIGPHGGPAERAGFALTRGTHDADVLQVGAGSYYVDGVRCEVGVSPSAGLSIDLGELEVQDGHHLVCLEIWDRHVTHVELPMIRELALRGADTCSRAQTTWSLKLCALGDDQRKQLLGDVDPASPVTRDKADALAQHYTASSKNRPRPFLRARAKQDERPEPCARSPEARYRGPENQLYRVELHQPSAPLTRAGSPATSPVPLFHFKWSRENGSVIFPVIRGAGPEKNERAETTTVSLELAHLGRDARFGLVPGDIVELIDDRVVKPGPSYIADGALERGRSGPLGTIREVDPERRMVLVEVHSGDAFELADATQHPYLRRWDQREPRRDPKRDEPARALKRGAVPVYESDLDSRWIELEDGVAVQFTRPDPPPEGRPGEDDEAVPDKLKASAMRPLAGDYWSIPARVASADVLWPKDAAGEQPRALPPHGVERHIAPIAVLTIAKGRSEVSVVDLRKVFAPLTLIVAP